MKKSTMILAASLAALLSACGEKESDVPAAPATTPAPAPAAPEAPATPPASEAPAAPAASEAPAAAPAAPAAPAASAANGASVYNKTCSLCHAAGVAGAPKPGDKADWGPRIAQGKDLLYKHAIEGFTGAKGMMPPRGGGASLTDEEVKAAVDYMVGKSS
ncbi:c-type cytochrome [Aromatoleum buckelii]|uniref:C-type cytochrome n=1 Tax=Aromatoleum buckelii TaxID=200254 RepID=A0ABX1MW82_9RHOO|nr:c-type cytochrome [Aromatoleum buckelii]MCK0512903.1 c-type cytochrome [Aromatoleum buckelii]